MVNECCDETVVSNTTNISSTRHGSQIPIVATIYNMSTMTLNFTLCPMTVAQ